MTTATLITATVKYAASTPKDFGHGDRINVVLTPTSGEDIKVWGKPNDSIAQLRRGQSVQVLWDGKSHKLVETDQPAPAVPQAQPQSPETAEEAFDAALRVSAKRYAKAIKLAKAIALQELGVEAIDDPQILTAVKDIASSLFIESSRLTG